MSSAPKLYSAKANFVKCVFNFSVNPRKFRFAQKFWFLYNLFIDDKEWHMTDADFFSLNQEQWFREFVETEPSKNLPAIYVHDKFFEFDDVPQ